MNREQCATIIGYLASAYPQTTVSQQTAMVWAEQIASQDASVAFAAARQIVRDSKWFPSIAEYLVECRNERERRKTQELLAELDNPAREELRRIGLEFIPLCREAWQSARKRDEDAA